MTSVNRNSVGRSQFETPALDVLQAQVEALDREKDRPRRQGLWSGATAYELAADGLEFLARELGEHLPKLVVARVGIVVQAPCALLQQRKEMLALMLLGVVLGGFPGRRHESVVLEQVLQFGVEAPA